MDEPAGGADEGDPGSADDRAGDAVDHLRAAAHELIGAVRGFLDVAEELIDDPRAGEAIVDTVTSVADAARRGARSAGRAGRPAAPGDEYEHIDLAD